MWRSALAVVLSLVFASPVSVTQPLFGGKSGAPYTDDCASLGENAGYRHTGTAEAAGLYRSFGVASLQKLDRDATTGADGAAERIRADVTYLASDRLEGRRTGTDGANAAAEYIAAEFRKLGLKPGGGASRTLDKTSPAYMQRFAFVSGLELGKANEMLIGPAIPAEESARMSVATMDGRSREALVRGLRARSQALKPGEDWLPLGFSSNGRVEFKNAVFVGYGITAAELKHDDYADSDVKGKIAIALEGAPDGGNPHSEFTRFSDIRWKAIAARDHGASALVVIARESEFKDDSLSRLKYDNASGDAGIITVGVSRRVASNLLTDGGLAPLEELEKTSSGSNPMKGRPAQLKDVNLTIAADVIRKDSPSANVVGILEGADPRLKNEAIVIGAHYDHLGRGGEGSLAPREGDIHHGADDNASGVAGLLELARMITSDRANQRRSVVFIAFSGEEEGLIGSSYYVSKPVVPLAQTVAMINMDMIGRMRDDKLTVGGVGTAKEWRERVASANAEHPAGSSPFVLALNDDGYGPSDHSSFYSKQIPVLFFFTGTHDDYHKPTDTADKIDYNGETRIVSMVARIVKGVSVDANRPTYTLAKSDNAGRSTGFRVYLGTIPNYADSTNGLTLDGVREGSPAAKAGLKTGDRIVKIAGREVKNVYDYTYALGEMKAGVEYEVELVRGSEVVKVKVTPEGRK
jgi:aminopeptidase YwaD